MGKSSSDSQVATEIVDGVGSSVPRETLFGEGSLVERPIGVENELLIVLGSVFVEEILREEGELCGVPGVGGEHGAEDDAAETDTKRGKNSVSLRSER